MLKEEDDLSDLEVSSDDDDDDDDDTAGQGSQMRRKPYARRACGTKSFSLLCFQINH